MNLVNYIKNEYYFYNPEKIINAYDDIKNKFLNNKNFMSHVNIYNSKEDIYNMFLNIVSDYILDLIPNNMKDVKEMVIFNIMVEHTFFNIWTDNMFNEIYKV